MLTLTPQNKLASCIVRTVYETLDKDDQLILNQALADNDSYPADTLALQLKQQNIQISGSMIRKHRRGGCSC